MRTCIGIFFLSLAVLVGVTTYDLHCRVFPQINVTLQAVSKDADDLREMTNAALFQAEEVLHHTDQLLEVEKGAQQAQLAQTQKVLNQLASTIQSLDKSQQAVVSDVHNSLVPLPAMLDQTTDTLAQTRTDLKLLEPTIQNVNGITADLHTTSTALAKVVENATKPHHWYAKIPNDAWAALKLVLTVGKF